MAAGSGEMVGSAVGELVALGSIRVTREIDGVAVEDWAVGGIGDGMTVSEAVEVAGEVGLSFVLAQPAVKSARQAVKKNTVIFIRLDYIRLWIPVCEFQGGFTHQCCELSRSFWTQVHCAVCKFTG